MNHKILSFLPAWLWVGGDKIKPFHTHGWFPWQQIPILRLAVSLLDFALLE